MKDENQVELGEAVQSENPTTKVKVAMTKVKYFDSDTNLVEEKTIIGRLTIVECKKLVTNENPKNIFISKENLHEQFSVDSIALYQLKGV